MYEPLSAARFVQTWMCSRPPAWSGAFVITVFYCISVSPQVHPNVYAMADAHAYMMDMAEVIGMLLGRFDSKENVLYVQVIIGTSFLLCFIIWSDMIWFVL